MDVLFRNKANTLKNLKEKLQLSEIPELIIIFADDLSNDIDLICERIGDVFNGDDVAVRSSASDEDGSASAKAGEYESVLNVPSNDKIKLCQALRKVYSSYAAKRDVLKSDEIFIQRMVANVSMSGVLFTHDLNTGAPYYVVNYDDQSGLTDTVTSGASEYSNRTIYIFRNKINKLRSERHINLIKAVREIEEVMDSKFLDIEFIVDAFNKVHILQVRPISTQANWNRDIVSKISIELEGIEQFLCEKFGVLPDVIGKSTVFGQMPDWNPVEMIGRAPGKLAYSLYEHLITASSWRKARERMGYKNPEGQHLMLSLGGQPYIDARLSFNSFLPKNLCHTISEKLVNYWIKKLANNPNLHDKIEFEIAITTYDFNIEEKISLLIPGVLTKQEREEFIYQLKALTIPLLDDNAPGSIFEALKDIKKLNEINIRRSSIKSNWSSSELFKLLEQCIELGTIPFSILARHGFIAQSLLNSLMEKELINDTDVKNFFGSFNTVAGEFVTDLKKLNQGKISERDFLSHYGHLRPGTYNIEALRYDQMPELISNNGEDDQAKNKFCFKLDSRKEKKIQKHLFKCGFDNLTTKELFNYIKDATIGREYSKFIFTRTVSDILEYIAKFGIDNGLTREELSHVGISPILDVIKKSNGVSIEKQLREMASTNRTSNLTTAAIRLPQILVDLEGVYVIPFQISHPNFITQDSITGNICILDELKSTDDISGKIVLIENADPGYDWIFSKNIVGLITKYGGANSHMAIRCAEFNIPAAIGCGEQRYNLYSQASKIQIDCFAGVINKIG